jgi:hypothetical protein
MAETPLAQPSALRHSTPPQQRRHEFLVVEFERRIAGDEPLLDIADWYAGQYYSDANVELRLDHGKWDCSAAELAALGLDRAGFKSEAEITARACDCANRRDNECTCYTTLKSARVVLAHDPIRIATVNIFTGVENALCADMHEALRARGDKVIPQRIDLWTAMLFLAPLRNELAECLLAQILRPRPDYDPTPTSEITFQDSRYIALLYTALDAHPDYDASDREIVWRWYKAGVEVAESARLVDWFRANHPMQAYRIECDVKLKLRKQGRRV